MVSPTGALVRGENAGETYLGAGLKGLLAGTEEDATAVEVGIKILDKNCDDVFGARAAWSLLIRLFSVSTPETVSQSLWMSCPRVWR
jgi:predicted oxidoreductase